MRIDEQARPPDHGDRLRRRSPASAIRVVLVCLGLAVVGAASAAPSTQHLAKLAQNPIANLISVPFQNNTNLNYGPEDGTQNILNIQPVIPITLNKDWNLITRTILPLIWQPGLGPEQDSTFGLGDAQFSAFLSPRNAKRWLWGVGAIAQLPTHTDRALGNQNWGLGPTLVALRMDKGDPWVYGALINNVWSVDSSDDPSYNKGLIQPFLNYNFKGGVYLTSAPVVTVDWYADSDDRWTLPVGGGLGKIVRFGKLPVNMQLSGYYNVIRPDNGADWQVRAQVQLMFPR